MVDSELVVNQTYSGLRVFVRDANLSEKVAGEYKKGMILLERGFCDASRRVMGMVTTHRYGILSNHMADFGALDLVNNWGLYVAPAGSRFKVLENYDYEGKTLILLLHLPDDGWELFQDAEFDIDGPITEDCLDRFRYKCVQEPIPELSTPEWLERCRAPIGMDEEGNRFPITDNSEGQAESWRQQYLKFWTKFLNPLTLDDPGQPLPNPVSAGNITFPLPPSGSVAWITTFFDKSKKEVGCFIRLANNPNGRDLYQALFDEKEDIEKDLPFQVSWNDERRMILRSKTVGPDWPPFNDESIIPFLAETVNGMVNTFRPRLERLSGN